MHAQHLIVAPPLADWQGAPDHDNVPLWPERQIRAQNLTLAVHPARRLIGTEQVQRLVLYVQSDSIPRLRPESLETPPVLTVGRERIRQIRADAGQFRQAIGAPGVAPRGLSLDGAAD